MKIKFILRHSITRGLQLMRTTTIVHGEYVKLSTLKIFFLFS